MGLAIANTTSNLSEIPSGELTTSNIQSIQSSPGYLETMKLRRKVRHTDFSVLTAESVLPENRPEDNQHARITSEIMRQLAPGSKVYTANTSFPYSHFENTMKTACYSQTPLKTLLEAMYSSIIDQDNQLIDTATSHNISAISSSLGVSREFFSFHLTTMLISSKAELVSMYRKLPAETKKYFDKVYGSLDNILALSENLKSEFGIKNPVKENQKENLLSTLYEKMDSYLKNDSVIANKRSELEQKLIAFKNRDGIFVQAAGNSAEFVSTPEQTTIEANTQMLVVGTTDRLNGFKPHSQSSKGSLVSIVANSAYGQDATSFSTPYMTEFILLEQEYAKEHGLSLSKQAIVDKLKASARKDKVVKPAVVDAGIEAAIKAKNQ